MIQLLLRYSVNDIYILLQSVDDTLLQSVDDNIIAAVEDILLQQSKIYYCSGESMIYYCSSRWYIITVGALDDILLQLEQSMIITLEQSMIYYCWGIRSMIRCSIKSWYRSQNVILPRRDFIDATTYYLCTQWYVVALRGCIGG